MRAWEWLIVIDRIIIPQKQTMPAYSAEAFRAASRDNSHDGVAGRVQDKIVTENDDLLDFPPFLFA